MKAFGVGLYPTRRTVVKAAAWTIPSVALLAYSPRASASLNTAALSWTGVKKGLLSFIILSDGKTITAQTDVTVPTTLALANGSGGFEALASVTIVISRPSEWSGDLGRARGFGIYAMDNTPVDKSANTVDYKKDLGVEYGYPSTTFKGIRDFYMPANHTEEVPIEFGLSGTIKGISVFSVETKFPVTATVDFGGIRYSATTEIVVSAGANIL